MRKEGPAPAQCQPHHAGMTFSCRFLSLQELCSEQGATKPPVLVRVATGRFVQQSLELLALILVQIMKKKRRPSSWWEPASFISRGFLPCAIQHNTGGLLLTTTSHRLGFSGFCAAQLLHILFFNLPLADVFLSVTSRLSLWLSLALVGYGHRLEMCHL